MSQLSGVQVLRAFAAFMVAIHHAQHEANLLAPGFGQFDLLPWMAGVDIFFVVSGFIMVHACAGLFGQPGAAGLFLGRRLVRIVPLYWAVTTALLVVGVVLPGALSQDSFGLREIIASYLFWPMALADGRMQPVYSLGWSLNYEMAFYALFALALLAGRDARMTVAMVAGMLILLVLAVATGLAPSWQPVRFWGQPIVLEFVAGMAIGLLRLHGWRLGGSLRWALALAAVAVLVLGRNLPQTGWPSTFIFGGAGTMLVAAAALGKGITAPSMLVRYWVAIGDASYALYLTHPFVLRAVRMGMQKLGLIAPWSFLLISLTLVLIAAVLTYRLFEKPVTNALRRSFRL